MRSDFSNLKVLRLSRTDLHDIQTRSRGKFHRMTVPAPIVGQFIHVSLHPNNQHTEFKLYAPGKWPGEKIHNSKANGSCEFKGRVKKDGFHAIVASRDQGACGEGEASARVMVQVPGTKARWQRNWGYRDGNPAVLEVFYASEG